jgi:hypothetical protein
MSKPVERWTDKYAKRTAVAKDDYAWGVQNPSRPPVEAAIEQRRTLEAKMASKSTWDKWQDALSFVGSEGVKKAAAEKGADRYLPGVQFGMPKFTDFASKFKTHLDAQLPTIRKMSTATLDESIAKAAAMIKANAAFRFKKK